MLSSPNELKVEGSNEYADMGRFLRYKRLLGL